MEIRPPSQKNPNKPTYHFAYQIKFILKRIALIIHIGKGGVQDTHSSHKLNFVQYAVISFLTSLKNKVGLKLLLLQLLLLRSLRWALIYCCYSRYTDKQLSPHYSYYVIPTIHSTL